MMQRLKYGVLLLCLTCAISVAGAQKDSVAFITLSGNIFTDRTLTKARYLVQNNLRVSKEATLTIEAGSELVFNPGTEIVVLGGLTISGKQGNFVKLYSLNGSDEGVGISITGDNPAGEIHITYTDFSGLIRPLAFDNNWYRAAVSITQCQFRNINTNDAGIIVGEPEHMKNTTVAGFDFSHNTFADNQSNIRFKSLSSLTVQYSFSHNLVVNNSFHDYKTRAKDNAVYGELDDNPDKKLITLHDNVIADNYIFHEYADTVIDRAGFGAEGTSTEMSIAGNYWGTTNEKIISASTYGFHKDKFAPAVITAPELKLYPNGIHTFIHKVIPDSGTFDQTLPVTAYLGHELTLELSKGIAKNQYPVLTAVYLDTSIGQILSQPITDFTFSYTAGSRQAKLKIIKVAGIEHAFYLVFNGLKDEEGFELPALNIGKLYLNRIYGEYKINNKIDLELFLANASQWKALPQDGGVIETVDPVLKELEKKERTYEFGVMLGVTNYFGDLSTNDFNRDEINPNFGLRGRYNFSKRFSVRGMFDYAHLSGNDFKSSNEYRFMRGLSFRSVLYDLTFELEYHLNHYVFSDKNRFVPSIGTGLTLFHFNPKTKYNGKWYTLHDIGTEGQTSIPGAKNYSRTQLAIPISGSFKTLLGYHFIAEAEVNFVKTFTDYLDDVSGRYPNIAAVQAANQGTDPDVISHIVDPSAGKFSEGSSRGDQRHKDWYLLIGFSLSYRF